MLIDGIEKISKYQLQTPPSPDLIRVMQRHPSRPSVRRLFRAAIEKILTDPSILKRQAFKKELSIRGQAEQPSHAQRRIAWDVEGDGIPGRIGSMVMTVAGARPRCRARRPISLGN
jgi:hypothetical protein